MLKMVRYDVTYYASQHVHFFFPTPPILPFFAAGFDLLSASFRLPVVLCLVVTAPKKDSSRPAYSCLSATQQCHAL